MNTVTFGEKNIGELYSAYLSEKHIGVPKARTLSVEVPGRDGEVDLTEAVLGRISYGNREVKMTWTLTGTEGERESAIVQIIKDIHGKHVEFRFDNGVSLVYQGRITVSREDDFFTFVDVKCDCDPYRYDIFSAGEEWLWDNFSFEDGIIYPNEENVNGRTTVILPCRQSHTTVVIEVLSGNCTMEFGGKTYQLKTGNNIMHEIVLVAGDNTVVFNGNGRIKIKYRGKEI